MVKFEISTVVKIEIVFVWVMTLYYVYVYVCVCVSVFQVNLSTFISSPESWSITIIDILSLRDVCFLFVWISGVSALLPKPILLRDNISATWAN